MFAYPSQRLQDWLSQQWVIARGRRINPADVPWLMGPYGEVDAIADHHIDRLARDENLTIRRRVADGGLLESADALNLPPDDAQRLDSRILDFYLRTARYDLEFWSEWSPSAATGGRLIRRLWSERLEQLNLPARPLDAARGMRSEIIKLDDPGTGETRYTFWHRILKATNRVIYSGQYGACTIPDGRTCIKVVFPLPRGNATVVMSVHVGDDGRLTLRSEGEKFGDPGFYFLLRDARGRHHAQYIRSFRESIEVFTDEEGTLRADHRLTLFRRKVMWLHYKMQPMAYADAAEQNGAAGCG